MHLTEKMGNKLSARPVPWQGNPVPPGRGCCSSLHRLELLRQAQAKYGN